MTKDLKGHGVQVYTCARESCLHALARTLIILLVDQLMQFTCTIEVRNNRKIPCFQIIFAEITTAREIIMLKYLTSKT